MSPLKLAAGVSAVMAVASSAAILFATPQGALSGGIFAVGVIVVVMTAGAVAERRRTTVR